MAVARQRGVEPIMEESDNQTIRVAVNEAIAAVSGRLSIKVGVAQLSRYPVVVLPAALVAFGNKVSEGQLIEGVAIPWFDILRE